MVNKLLEIDLPIELWEIIETEFKLNGETDSEILCNIIRNHLAEHGFHANIHSLAHGHGVRDYLDIHALMIESLLELLDKKNLVPSKEFAEVMDQKMINE